MKRFLFPLLIFITTICFSQETNRTLLQLEEHQNNGVSNTEKIIALLNIGEYELDYNFRKAENM
ncbi:hypothetical protein [Kordia sp.]|uniref:hypothetical protein n=1 Tax=Kordia sp. TaxID=1965332 RepID=UPI0025C70689|nr:hypothetical protein [Kordia sp.]MCH2193200.1 hypothetical protein [Kordia sp.]